MTQITKILEKNWNMVREERDQTSEMRRVLDFLSQTRLGTRGRSRGSEHLLDQENLGEPTLAELPHDPEPIVIDLHIPYSIIDVV